MAENVGGIYYEVDADTSGLLRAERDVDQSTKRMEQGFKDSSRETDKLNKEMSRLTPTARGVRQETRRVAGSLDGMRKAAKLAASALAVVGVTMGLRDALSQVMDFQDAMNGLAAVSGATEEQMASLERQARSLGATSKFSADQAGNAQRFLAQAGFEVNEILEATPGLLQLASAGQLDLARAADIASNVLGGMRLEVEELGRVNDVLAATAARSNTNVEQLGQALSYAAPFAAGAGIEIEDLAAAIGVMSDAGIQGSRAGTGMIGVIRQLSNVTSAGESVLDRYGLSLEDVDISVRGLEPVLNTLREANLTTADSIQLFGSEAGAAAQVLVSDYKGGIEDATGEAERMAQQLDQGLRPALRSLQSAMAESILQLGDSGIAGGLENVIRLTTGVISVWNGMGDAWAEANGVGERTLRTIEGVARAIQVMAAMAAGRAVQGIGSLIVAKAGLTTATLTLTGAITGLRTAMMTLFGPVGLVAGAAMLLYTFRENLGFTADRLDDVERVTRATDSAMNNLETAIDGASEAALDANYQELTEQLFDVGRAAAAARQELAELEAQEARRRDQDSSWWRGATGGQQFEQRGDDLSAIVEGRNALEEFAKQEERIRAGMERNEEAREEAANRRAERQRVRQHQHDSDNESNERTTRSLSRARDEDADKTDQQAQAQQRLLDRLYPLKAAAREYQRELDVIDEAAEAGKIDDKADAQRRLAEAYRETIESLGGFDDVFDAYPQLFDPEEQDGDFWTQWLEGAENAFTNFDEMAANTADRFTSAFGNAFERMIFDSESAGDAFRGLADTMLRSIVNALGQMAAQWLAYQAVQLLVSRSTATQEGMRQSAFAQAKVFEAGLNAFASTAAIPVVGPAMAPGAAKAAMATTQPMASAVQSLALTGMAHDGIDSIPREGTWLLDKGERVVGADLNRDLGQFLERERGGRSGSGEPVQTRINVNLFESIEQAGQVVEQPPNGDGTQDIDVFVADIMGDGPRSQAIRSKFGLQPRGR